MKVFYRPTETAAPSAKGTMMPTTEVVADARKLVAPEDAEVDFDRD